MPDAPIKWYARQSKNKQIPWAKGLPDNTGVSKSMTDVTEEIKENQRRRKTLSSSKKMTIEMGTIATYPARS